MAAFHRAAVAEHRDLPDGGDADLHRALSVHGGVGAERSGRRAVEALRRRHGARPQALRDEGLHILLPWDKLFLYDLRLQSITETYHAITRDGVSIGATINVRFQLQHDFVPKLHVAAGPDYLNLLVRPEIGSRVREVIAEFTAEEVYSTKRQEIQDSRPRTHEEDDGRNGRARARRAAAHQAQRDAQHLRRADPGHRAARGRGRRHQPQDRAVLHRRGIQVPRRARAPRVGAQADRGGRHPRISSRP